jgi:hypothetical protein
MDRRKSRKMVGIIIAAAVEEATERRNAEDPDNSNFLWM